MPCTLPLAPIAGIPEMLLPPPRRPQHLCCPEPRRISLPPSSSRRSSRLPWSQALAPSPLTGLHRHRGSPASRLQPDPPDPVVSDPFPVFRHAPSNLLQLPWPPLTAPSATSRNRSYPSSTPSQTSSWFGPKPVSSETASE